MKKESVLKSMDKKSNTEYGIHTDPKSPLQSSVGSPKPVSTQEPKSFISVPPQEPLSHTFLISLAPKDSSTQLSSHIESEETWLTWPKREPISSQSSMMPENPKITDSWLVWSTVSLLMLPNQVKLESLLKILTCT